MDKFIHLVKLSVGTNSVDDLAAWQATVAARHTDGRPCHVTRMWPKRETEIVNGGSIFWVIKGLIQARQKILRLDEVFGRDGIRRCAIVLDSHLQRTETAPKRPFQGWRYLQPNDAPRDLSASRVGDTPIPLELTQALAEIGVR